MTGAASPPAHAALAPSSAYIWAPEKGCRGSVAMQQKYPEDKESDEAREGTAAHHYVAEILNGRDVEVGTFAPNGVPINAEMVDCAQALLVDVRDTMKANPDGQLYIEQRFNMSTSIHALCWGTPDVVLAVFSRKVVFVWDYKYGHGYVDAAGNWQLFAYLLGVLETMGVPPSEWHEWTAVLSVAQPRNYHQSGSLRDWQFRVGSQVAKEMHEAIRLGAYQAMLPNAELRTGDHCTHCTARHACPALQRAGGLAMDVALRSQPVDLPPHAVGLELRQINDAINRLEARKTGLDEHALGLIRSGTHVPFFSTEYASGREKFVVPAAEVFALGDMLGADLRKPAEAITPGQARTALKKLGIDGEVISSYAEKPRGALRLVRVNDDAAKLAFQ
jgi:hypothetical protein